ncbi:MAG: cation-translocating P-type ATPase [Burkholderiales bacterium]|nr:cation-translocating P-type ATPase [Burkholderiales bacterium]
MHNISDISPAQEHSSGLTHEEVAQRMRDGQVNRVKRATSRPISGILSSNIVTLFNGVLAGSIAALLVIKSYSDAFFLSTVTFGNMLVGIMGELRAKWALDRIALLRKRSAVVIRAGMEQEIRSDDVVKDDHVAFSTGDQIVADGVFISSVPAFMDESLLTGESHVIRKNPGDPVFSGSYCVRGSGRYVATGVGSASKVNELAEQAKKYRNMRSPLQQDVNSIIQVLTAVMILFVLLLLLANFIKQVPLTANILSIVTVIKSLVPEGLVLILTLAFALGAMRAAKRKVLVQRLCAIESMSHLTTLCLDKTGTLGTNRLNFDELVFLTPLYDETVGKLKCYTGSVREKNQTLLAIEAKYPGISCEIIEEFPFSSESKVSAVRIMKDGQEITLWLGAPEALCGDHLTASQESMLKGFRQKGLRVLAFASTPQVIPYRNDLSVLAFIALRDELRPDVTDAIKFYESRDVKLKILSGDHPETVAALAREVGMSINGDLLSGPELPDAESAEFRTAIEKGQFFGRLSPQQKMQIVKCLQESGEYVGMVGDGINDILALKQADIGVAMNTGAAAARDVADIVLLKDAFTYLPAASEEGDRIIYNIKRVSRLFLTKNIYTLFFILFSGFVGLEFPLSPRYITWIDLLTIGIPTTILTFMTPVFRRQSVDHFLYETTKFALVTGFSIAFFSLFTYVNFFFLDGGAGSGKTAAVSVIVLMGLYTVFHVSSIERSPSAAWRQRWGVWAILVGAVLFHIIAVYTPIMVGFFGLTPLDPLAWGIIVAVSAVGMLVIRRLLKKAGVANAF